jgi:succinoglycan biosynthesis protein ExoO
MLTALSATCREFRPDIVLVEYVALAYLHEAVPAGVLKAIDTHDVMHLRRQAYDRAGLPHWLDLDRDEEAAALRPFDIVLAIQEEEAGIFRAMLPGTRVLTCPPWFEANDTAGQTGAETAPPGAFRLLLVASRMEANVRGLDDFLRESWPAVRRARPDCVLRVCGTVCEPFAGQRHPGVAFLGFVPDLTAEYRTADVVISPVTFGGGIKVKCLEALAHGCACVFSRHSVVGLEPPGRETWLVAGDPAEFAACLVALAGDPERRTALRREAVGYIRTCYGAERSMGPFLAALKEMLAARAPDAENGGSTRT